MNAAEVAAALGGSGKCYGAWWRCPCPAHELISESLAIRDGGHFDIIVKCFAGCTREAVVAAINAKLGTEFGRINHAREDFDGIDAATIEPARPRRSA